MKFFLDENISHVLAKALSCLERDDKPDFLDKIYIKHTFDMYSEDQRPVADDRWIPEMTQAGYIIITVDHAQKKNRGKHEAESRAYREHIASTMRLRSGFRKRSCQLPVNRNGSRLLGFSSGGQRSSNALNEPAPANYLISARRASRSCETSPRK